MLAYGEQLSGKFDIAVINECQNHVSEFAENQLAGLPIDEVLARVEHHLTLCPQCREEFIALEKILRAAE